MKLIKYEVINYKKYCEPYGSNFKHGIDVINQGYNGELHCNLTNRCYTDFWRILKENPDKLLKEIGFMINQLELQETIQDEANFINKKMNERKSVQRAAAQYIELYGDLRDNNIIRKHINELRDSTYLVNWHSVDPEEFIREQDSPDTLFYIAPNIQVNMLSSVMFDLLSYIQGSWILDYFYSKEIIEKYKKFNIRYTYNSSAGADLKVKAIITNIY